MKSFVFCLTVILSMCIGAEPSDNTFSAVTNDWYQANFSNVYELAQCRLTVNSNDVVAAFLMHDWNMAFGYASDISNGINQVIIASDLITNQTFAVVFARVRPAYVEYQQIFLPTLTNSIMDAERHKAYRPGRIMTSLYMLKLLHDADLW